MVGPPPSLAGTGHQVTRIHCHRDIKGGPVMNALRSYLKRDIPIRKQESSSLQLGPFVIHEQSQFRRSP